MEIFDRFTGKAVESKLDEYSEVYGEVLLGIHRELQSQKERVESLTAQVEELASQLQVLESEGRASRSEDSSRIEKLQRSIRLTRWLSIVAVLLAIFASLILMAGS